MNTRKKIALIGAGNIGGSLAYLACLKQLGDVVLYDVVAGVPQGKALDITHAAAVFGSSVTITGTNDYQDLADADVCIVTAGLPRKPGMSRDDLLATNANIVRVVGKGIRENAPQSFVIVVSNPLDAMVTLCQRETGFPPHRVVGMAGVLDSARYQAFLAQELHISPLSVSAFVLGGHGDDMVPVRSFTTVNGVGISHFLSAERLDAIENRVRKAGGEIVELLKGSAYYSPAAAAILMVESYLFDQKRVLACAAYLNGEYGCQGHYMGVPVIIGAGGVEKILEIQLTPEERQALDESASRVRELLTHLPT